MEEELVGFYGCMSCYSRVGTLKYLNIDSFFFFFFFYLPVITTGV